MSYRSRVVWSEGLFLLPQHFQQQDRHVDFVLGRVAQATSAFLWGFRSFQFDREQLAVGKFALSRGEGLFPDGTPFSFPEHDAAPELLDLGERGLRDELVYLAVPAYRPGGLEASMDDAPVDELVRYRAAEVELQDSTVRAGEGAPVQIGRLALRFMLQSQVRDDHLCIPVARIIECRPSGEVLVDDRFVPTVHALGGSDRLVGYLDETLKLLEQYGSSWAESLGDADIQSPQLANALRLMIVNRLLPRLRQLRAHPQMHPFVFHDLLVSLVGELATFKSPRIASDPAPYTHGDLTQSFGSVMQSLRNALSGTPTSREAESIPVEAFGDALGGGVFGAVVHDKNLLNRTFVLAVRAQLAPDEIRQRAPREIFVATDDRLKDVIRGHEPGMRLRPLPQVPPAIPFHDGFVYFEVARDAHWQERLQGAAGFGIQVQSSIPGAALELWAVAGAVA